MRKRWQPRSKVLKSRIISVRSTACTICASASKTMLIGILCVVLCRVLGQEEERLIPHMAQALDCSVWLPHGILRR